MHAPDDVYVHQVVTLYVPIFSTAPQEDMQTKLEDIRHERHLLQQTQRHMSADLVELRALRDMRQLVDAVQNSQCSSPLHTNQPELVQPPPPAGKEEDDWPPHHHGQIQ